MSNAELMLSFDELLDSITDVQRRRLLIALLEHDSLDESAVIAAAGTDAETVEQCTKMTHVHLPKLADVGLIEWDREWRDVEKGPKFDEIRPLLELLDTHDDALPNDWL